MVVDVDVIVDMELIDPHDPTARRARVWKVKATTPYKQGGREGGGRFEERERERRLIN